MSPRLSGHDSPPPPQLLQHITHILRGIRFIHTHIVLPLLAMLCQYIFYRRRMSLLKSQLDRVIRHAAVINLNPASDDQYGFADEVNAWLYLEGVRLCRAMEDARHEYLHFDGEYQCPECTRKAWWTAWMANEARSRHTCHTNPFIVKTLAELNTPGLRDLSQTPFDPPPFKWKRLSRPTAIAAVNLNCAARLSSIDGPMLDNEDACVAHEALVDSPLPTPSSSSSTLVPETPCPRPRSSLDTFDSTSTLVDSILTPPRKSSILLNPHGALDLDSPSPLSRKSSAPDHIVFDARYVKPDWTPSYLHRRRRVRPA